MAKINSEIKCFERLQDLTMCIDEMLTFLVEESLLSKEDIKDIRSSFSIAKSMCLTIQRLSNTGQLQLVEYEWQILPVERIKVLLVTNRVTKEFGYNI